MICLHMGSILKGRDHFYEPEVWADLDAFHSTSLLSIFPSVVTDLILSSSSEFLYFRYYSIQF